MCVFVRVCVYMHVCVKSASLRPNVMRLFQQNTFERKTDLYKKTIFVKSKNCTLSV